MNYFRILSITLSMALILAAYSWSRPGNSLCWIAETDTLKQVQFSPYYWHINRLLYSEIEALNVVESPNQPGQRVLEVVTPRLRLVYGFADSSWIDDLDTFQAEITGLIERRDGYSCRITTATALFAAACGIFIISLLLLLIHAFRRNRP